MFRLTINWWSAAIDGKSGISSIDGGHPDVVVCPVKTPEAMEPESGSILPLGDPATHVCV